MTTTQRNRTGHCTRTRALILTAALWASFLWGWFPHAVCAQRFRRQAIELLVGDQTSISATDVRSYSLSVQEIIDVRVTRDGSQFILVALKPGFTTLQLIMESGAQTQYQVTVRSREEATGGVEERDNIRLDFYFVQLTESYNHQLGISWPAFLGGQGIDAQFVFDSSGLAEATASIANQPLPRIDLLQRSGWARIAQHATVITANGSQAVFNSGGELNVPVVAQLTASLQQIGFGSRVGVRPLYDDESGRLELQIDAEVAELEESNTEVPSRIATSVQTAVNLELGQSVMLGGLMGSSMRRQKGGLPGLSQIPILGVLFGSHAESQRQTQNVLFIVPSLVDSVSLEARGQIRESLELYWDYSGGLEDVELVKVPEHTPSGAHPHALEEKARGRRR